MPTIATMTTDTPVSENPAVPTVSVVTGANSGIGRATAIHLAAQGHTVFGTVRSISKAGKLEAMLHGVPAVAMAVGGVPEVISDGEDGLLVPPGSLDGFSEALSRLLSDASLRQRLGAAAVEKVRSMFLFDARMQKMLALYEAAVAKATSTTAARGHA